jgi:hypothetical protein
MSTTAPKKPVSKAAWVKAKRHEIHLASSPDTVVAVVIPNLPELIKSGEFPNHLIDVAINVAGGQKVTAEHIGEQAEFYRHLIATTVVEPALTPEDVKELPFEDVELIASIATRQRDVDALGNQIGGLHLTEEWRKFRGVEYLD